MESDFMEPVNIGSEEMVSINAMVDIAASFEDTKILKNHIPGPQGVRGRNSDNRLIERILHWTPDYDLEKGLKITYEWIKEEWKKKNSN
jgi:GDP-D-mannose 3',5'-epimerase